MRRPRHAFGATDWFIAVLARVGVSAIALVLLGVPTIVAAQDVLPSQVTPQTLRPPPSGERSIENYGPDNPTALEGLKRKRGKQKAEPSKPGDGRPSVRPGPAKRD